MKHVSHNPVLQKLGLDSRSRAVIIHVDDVGMCDSSVASFSEMVDFGIVSSGSVMVPCPGFDLLTQWAKKNPHFDLGVHLTLTSEWDNLRWGPISTTNPNSGFIDKDGYFHQTRDALWQNVSTEHIYFEMESQLNLAINAGINVSHLDAHMFAAMSSDILPYYIKLGKEYSKTVFLEKSGWAKTDPLKINQKYIEGARKNNLPIFDRIVCNPLSFPAENVLENTKKIMQELPPGLSYFITHPAEATKEMKEITTDWRNRDAEFKVFTSNEAKKAIADSGVEVISFRDINEALNS